MQPLLKQLTAFGLSEKEARIYLALLELGSATVFEVAKTSGINRSSAYVVLEALKKKGLVGTSDDKKVRRYTASSPELLAHAARQQAQKQEFIKNSIENILPELKAIHKETKHKPSIKVFEGENGAREVYWSLFASKTKELRTYANPINIFSRIPDFMEHDRERAKKGIKMYAINPALPEMLDMYKRVRPHKPFEALLIPPDKFNFSADMGISDTTVLFVSPKDNFGFTIESREIAEMLKNSFDLAWQEAKRLDAQIKSKLAKKRKLSRK